MRRKPGALVPLELSVLWAIAGLSKSGVTECHGYEIARRIADASECRLLTAYGTLYRALGRLENMGLLESRWEEPRPAGEQARPGRRLYRLTDAGRAAAPARTRRRVIPSPTRKPSTA